MNSEQKADLAYLEDRAAQDDIEAAVIIELSYDVEVNRYVPTVHWLWDQTKLTPASALQVRLEIGRAAERLKAGYNNPE